MKQEICFELSSVSRVNTVISRDINILRLYDHSIDMPYYKPPLWIALIFAGCVVFTFFVHTHIHPNKLTRYFTRKPTPQQYWPRSSGHIYDGLDDVVNVVDDSNSPMKNSQLFSGIICSPEQIETDREAGVIRHVDPVNSSRDIVLARDSEQIMNWIRGDPGEIAVHKLFRELFMRHCSEGYTFVDVGANAGFYCMLAVYHGCRCVAIDPQPSCTSLVRRNACLNFGASMDSVAVIEGYVDSKNSHAMLSFPQHCEGTFAILNSTMHVINVNSVVLDDLLLSADLGQFIVKVDTEGYELHALGSMRQLIEHGRVQNMIVEVTPLFWERHGHTSRLEVFAEIYYWFKHGCKVRRIHGPGGRDITLESVELLRWYLMEYEFVQEDLHIDCTKLQHDL
jgi:FkbM family methyltransferase